MGPEIFQYSFEEAGREEILSPFSVCEVSTSFSAEESAEYGRLTVEISSLLKKLYQAHPGLEKLEKLRFLRTVSKLAHEAEMNPEDPAAAFLLKTYQRKEISVLASSRVQCGLALLEQLRPMDRIIFFCERITQADEMARLIRRRFGNICVLYHSGLTKEARERNMLLFRGKSVRVLVSCRCLDEGIDVPDANIGIVLSGSAVERQHIQRMGRLIRRAEGKDAACLYHISIGEAAEDSAFLPGLNPTEKFSLRYYPAEKDFSNDRHRIGRASRLPHGRYDPRRLPAAGSHIAKKHSNRGGHAREKLLAVDAESASGVCGAEKRVCVNLFDKAPRNGAAEQSLFAGIRWRSTHLIRAASRPTFPSRGRLLER